MPGLIQPTPSTDATAPTVDITAPGPGANLGNGASVTVSGTAVDAGGGVVTTVEVSLDGGETYTRAIGTTDWTYTGVLSGNGDQSIKVRASDDSASLSTPVSLDVTVSCPCSLFGERVPDNPATNDSSPVELGVKFVPAADGFISGIRFYKGTGNTGTHTGTLWTSSGTALASGTFVGETSTGWQTMEFGTAVPVTGGSTYVASYFAPSGHYAASQGFFDSDWAAPPLLAPGASSGVANGVYAGSHSFPSQSYEDTNYWVDVVYTLDDTTPPAVSLTSPLNGATSVPPSVRPSATFAGTVDPDTVVMSLVDDAGTTVPGSAAFDEATRTVRYTPDAPLSYGATYRAAVEAESAAGVPMQSPHSWMFTVSLTDPQPGICPCSIWPDSALPDVASDTDTGNVQLGVKFRADVNGTVDGVRFYKGPLNLGTHTGSLWTSSGALLATVTFTGESTTGWQTAYFSSPVDILADTTYIVSYNAPAGGYSVTVGGLAQAVDSGPLHALAGGAVYTYGSGAPQTASANNYWVDLVFTATDAAPTVASTQPADAATNVNVGNAVTANLAGYVQSGSATLELTDASGDPVTGAVSYDPFTRTVAFDPAAPLAEGSVYTATLSGATALSGAVMEPYTWQFTTAGVDNCPCTLFSSSAVPTTVDSGDGGAVTLGVGFTPDTDGQVTGLRFYKSALNTGTHRGSLWTSDGQVLATGTFTGESASGWQTLTFSQAVAVTAGSTYVVSYHAPNGHYSATGGFFAEAYSNGPLSATGANGLYAYGEAETFPTQTYGASNYWVDPVFLTGTPPDVTAPIVAATTPIDGATSQPVSIAPTATFDEDVDPTTIRFTLQAADGTPVGGTTTYDAATRTATFTPDTDLGQGVSFTAAIGASDAAGNTLAPAHTWTFTTTRPDPEPGVCPCSLWPDSTQPTSLTDVDSSSVELGTEFEADTDGAVVGVRYYKGPENTGSHPVSLWSDDGTLLATATSTSESSTGWQYVPFTTPVAITPGTSYVVSYLAPGGKYSSLSDGLASALDVPPLHTQADAGRYLYGTGGYPVNTSSTSYLVDPVFVDGSTPPADTTAPAISAVTATVDGTDATVTWTTDESATSEVAYGTSASDLSSSVSGATGTSHSVDLTGLNAGTTYYYRVTSADSAGNTTTSPDTGSAPGTFEVAAPSDTTAPDITDVAATGSGATAEVTWTTDETSDSTVEYGTTTTLGSTASGPSGTSHSVELTGLTPNTRYYYRVTSVDAAGNTATSPSTGSAPAEYVPDVTPIELTSAAQFAEGSGGYVADDTGGEILAAPTEGYEFSGTALPIALSASVRAGGSATVADGTATLDGAVLSGGTARTTSSLVVKATLAPGHILGMSRGNLTGGIRASLEVQPDGSLVALAAASTRDVVTTPVAGDFAGSPHVFEIRRVSGSTVTFLVDGTEVASSAFATTRSLYPMVDDPTVGDTTLELDWWRVGRYDASSTYLSGVVDAGGTVAWDTLTRDVEAPAGTSVTISVRSGDTATPGTGWTAWTTVPESTGVIAREARYLQVRLVLTSSADRFATPQTRSVTLAFHVR